jgi:hypothetical protein
MLTRFPRRTRRLQRLPKGAAPAMSVAAVDASHADLLDATEGVPPEAAPLELNLD